MDKKTTKRKYAKIRQGDKKSGVYLDSIVKNPAIRSSFVSLSAEDELQDPKLIKVGLTDDASQLMKFTGDKKQQLLVGPLLIPNIEIDRRDKVTGEIFPLVFTAEEIVLINRQRQTFKLTNSFNVEHSTPIEGLVNEEFWIVRDTDRDISAVLGIPQPVGTLMTSVYVPDAEQHQYLSENFNGFSIEGWFELVDDPNIQLSQDKIKIIKQNTNMKNKGFFASLFSFKNTASKIKLMEYPLQDGKMLVVDDATMVVTVDGQTPADGQYQLSDGSIAVIAGGKLSDVLQPNEDVAATQNLSTAPAPAPVATVPTPITPVAPAPVTPIADATKPAPVSDQNKLDIDTLKAELDKMKAMIAELTSAKTKLEEDKVELSKKIRGEASKADVLPKPNTATEKVSMADLAVAKLDKIQAMMK